MLSRIVPNMGCTCRNRPAAGVYLTARSAPWSSLVSHDLMTCNIKRLQRSGSWQFLKQPYTVIAIYGENQTPGSGRPFLSSGTNSFCKRTTIKRHLGCYVVRRRVLGARDAAGSPRTNPGSRLLLGSLDPVGVFGKRGQSAPAVTSARP